MQKTKIFLFLPSKSKSKTKTFFGEMEDFCRFKTFWKILDILWFLGSKIELLNGLDPSFRSFSLDPSLAFRMTGRGVQEDRERRTGGQRGGLRRTGRVYQNAESSRLSS